MLTQQRHEIILELLREKGSITVTEVKDLLDTSESTVRRDITALDKEGKLEKVFGGAVELKERVTAYEYSVAQKGTEAGGEGPGSQNMQQVLSRMRILSILMQVLLLGIS